MASSVPEGHYRIWVNRKDTHNRISDENIWVGNIPLDGKSKITSGYTIGPDYSYVEFNSWADLLKAIGVDGPVVEYVDVYGTFEQGAGGGGDDTGTTQYFLNVSASTTTVQHDGTLNLKAVYTTIQGSDITREDVTSRNDCVWQVVSGGEYATVEHGVVTNHNQGTGNKSATVRATYQGKSDEITLTMSGTGVEPEYSLIVSAATGYQTIIDASGSTKLDAVYVKKVSGVIEGMTGVTLNAAWSSASQYATVNGGVVNGKNNTDDLQTCRITASYSGKSGYCDVSVRGENYTFTITPASARVDSTATTQTFSITAQNVTNIGYDASHSSGVSSGTANSSSGTANFPENTNTASTKTITFAVSGKTPSGRSVYRTASFIQDAKKSPEDYELTLTPASVTLESTATTQSFTVTARNITNLGWDSSASENVTNGSVNSATAAASFTENTNTGQTKEIKFVISGKTPSNQTVRATAIITLNRKPTPRWNFTIARREFTSTSATTTASVDCDSDTVWTIALPDMVGNWIHVSPNSGTGPNSMITVTIDEYSGTTEDRQASIIGHGSKEGQDTGYIIVQHPSGTKTLSITYTGETLTSASGSTSDFVITAQNVTVTGYTISPNSASIPASGTSTVTVQYPANTGSTTMVYTITVRGKDSNNALVTASTTFNQAVDSYEFRIEPAATSVTFDTTAFTGTVIYTNITNYGYYSGSNVAHRTIIETWPTVSIDFSKNTDTGNTRDVSFTLSGKTTSGNIKYATATITQGKKGSYRLEIVPNSETIGNDGHVQLEAILWTPSGSTSTSGTVTSNCAWSITEGGAYADVDNGSNKGYVTGHNTDTSNDHDVTVQAVYQTEESGRLTATATITVQQAPMIPVFIIEDQSDRVFVCGTQDEELTIEISDETNVSWQTSAPEWVTVEGGSGTGGGIITISPKSGNFTTEAYEDEIVITPDQGEAIAINVIEVPTVLFDLADYSSPAEISVSPSGGTVEVRVRTNYEFSVDVPSSAQQWLDATVDGPYYDRVNEEAYYILEIEVDGNNGSSERRTSITLESQYDCSSPYACREDCESYLRPLYIAIEQGALSYWLEVNPSAATISSSGTITLQALLCSNASSQKTPVTANSWAIIDSQTIGVPSRDPASVNSYGVVTGENTGNDADGWNSHYAVVQATYSGLTAESVITVGPAERVFYITNVTGTEVFPDGYEIVFTEDCVGACFELFSIERNIPYTSHIESGPFEVDTTGCEFETGYLPRKIAASVSLPLSSCEQPEGTRRLVFETLNGERLQTLVIKKVGTWNPYRIGISPSTVNVLASGGTINFECWGTADAKFVQIPDAEGVTIVDSNGNPVSVGYTMELGIGHDKSFTMTIPPNTASTQATYFVQIQCLANEDEFGDMTVTQYANAVYIGDFEFSQYMTTSYTINASGHTWRYDGSLSTALEPDVIVMAHRWDAAGTIDEYFNVQTDPNRDYRFTTDLISSCPYGIDSSRLWVDEMPDWTGSSTYGPTTWSIEPNTDVGGARCVTEEFGAGVIHPFAFNIPSNQTTATTGNERCGYITLYYKAMGSFGWETIETSIEVCQEWEHVTPPSLDLFLNVPTTEGGNGQSLKEDDINVHTSGSMQKLYFSLVYNSNPLPMTYVIVAGQYTQYFDSSVVNVPTAWPTGQSSISMALDLNGNIPSTMVIEIEGTRDDDQSIKTTLTLTIHKN